MTLAPVSADVKRKMNKIEKKLIELHKRLSQVTVGINFSLVRHTFSRRTALGYTLELRKIADELEQLIRGLDERH
jgi:hypothetical protein